MYLTISFQKYQRTISGREQQGTDNMTRCVLRTFNSRHTDFPNRRFEVVAMREFGFFATQLISFNFKSSLKLTQAIGKLNNLAFRLRGKMKILTDDSGSTEMAMLAGSKLKGCTIMSPLE